MRFLRFLIFSVLLLFAGAAVVYSNAYFFGCSNQTSSPGTIVTTVGPTITDSAGNIWSLNASRQVVLNGTADGTTANVYEIAWANGLLYQENILLGWWYKAIPPTGAWIPTTNPLPLAAPTPVPLAVLYVNNTKSCPGSGTSAAPYCSIANALSNVAAGTDVRIQNTGTTYNESDILTTTGTAAHPITIESDNPASPPTLTNTTSTGNGSEQIYIHNVNYVTVQNLKWDGLGQNVSEYAIYIQNTSSSTNMVGLNILNNTINNWAAANTTLSYTGFGNAAIHVESYCNLGIQNTVNIIGNTLTGNRYTNLEMLCPLNSQVLNNIFSGTVCGIASGGVELGNEMLREDCYQNNENNLPNIATNTLYRNNVISNMSATCSLALPGGGYSEWAALHVDDACSGMIFDRNVVHDLVAPNASNIPTTYTGIHYEQHTAGGTISNNMVYNLSGGSHTGGARAIYVSPDVWTNGTNAPFTIVGNTVYNVSGAGGDAFTCEDGCTKLNNNIALNNGGAGYAYLTPTGPACSQCVFDYNDEWDASGGVRYGRVDYNSGPITFSAWKTATGHDAHSINVDPLLSSPTTQIFLQTATSPSLDTGIAVTNFIADILGVTRPSSPSMGAYEYPF